LGVVAVVVVVLVTRSILRSKLLRRRSILRSKLLRWSMLRSKLLGRWSILRSKLLERWSKESLCLNRSLNVGGTRHNWHCHWHRDRLGNRQPLDSLNVLRRPLDDGWVRLTVEFMVSRALLLLW